MAKSKNSIKDTSQFDIKYSDWRFDSRYIYSITFRDDLRRKASEGNEEDEGINITNVKNKENEGNLSIYFISNIYFMFIDTQNLNLINRKNGIEYLNKIKKQCRNSW